HSDAYSLLAGSNDDLLGRIRDALGDWELLPTALAPDPTLPTQSKNIQASTGQTAEGLRDTATSSPPIVLIHLPPPRSTDTIVGLAPPAPISTPVQETAATAPAEHAGITFAVGKTIDAFQQRQMFFFPGNTELNQLNVGIVGDLGTGKTQLVQSLLYQ